MFDYDTWLTTDKAGDEYTPLATDIYGTDLYDDNYYFETEDGIVASDNMVRYLIDKNELEEGATGWVTYFDDMQGNIEEYDTIKYDGYYLSTDTVYEFLDHIEWYAYVMKKEGEAND